VQAGVIIGDEQVVGHEAAQGERERRETKARETRELGAEQVGRDDRESGEDREEDLQR
jgi:hypothetical protein